MRDPQAGFTLIEVVVALAIAMLALSAIMAVVLPSRASTSLSAEYIEAARYARNHLQAVGVGGPLGGATQSGTDGNFYGWSVRVTPIAVRPVAPAPAATAPETAQAAPGAASTASLVDIEVVERWRYGLILHSVTLHTRKLLLTGADAG